MKEEKHPRLTAMRALELLKITSRARGVAEDAKFEIRCALDRIERELANHIAASLRGKR